MSNQQLLMDLPVRTAHGRDSFFVSPSNELALRQIEAWENWAGSKLILIGPESSGKSHLAAVWAELTGATVLNASDLGQETEGHVIVEDVEKIAGQADLEEALFHLHNRVLSEGASLLLTANETPEHWGIALPDLASRLKSADIARLGSPDDALLTAVLVKLFDDRQLNVGPDVITYLTTRIDRSLGGAERMVAKLDEASMRERKPISVKFAGRILKVRD